MRRRPKATSPTAARNVDAIDRAAAIASARRHITEARITRLRSKARDAKGRPVACLIASFDPETITDPAKCPASLMPVWLALLATQINDTGPSDARWRSFCIRFVDLIEASSLLDAAAWERARIEIGRALFDRCLRADFNGILAAARARWIAGERASSMTLDDLFGRADRATAARRHIYHFAALADPTLRVPVAMSLIFDSAAWALAWAEGIGPDAHKNAVYALANAALDAVEALCGKKRV